MLSQIQIDAINEVKRQSKELLVYGVWAKRTISEAYFDVIEAADDSEIISALENFGVFVVESNRKHEKETRLEKELE